MTAPHFDAAIPGHSLTKAPKSMPWQKPPKFTKLSDCCDFIFDKLTQEAALRQVVAFMEAKVPLESLARTLIMPGFSEGYWTPDMGMLMTRPVIFMLAGIAKRFGIDDVPTTNIDRSGMKGLVHLKQLQMSTSNPSGGNVSTPQPTPMAAPKSAPSGGLMAPLGAH